jgi:hypothetical protein
MAQAATPGRPRLRTAIHIARQQEETASASSPVTTPDSFARTSSAADVPAYE